MTEKNGFNASSETETDSETGKTGSEIAVIGMSGRFPGASGIDEFWNNLKNGIESLSFFTDRELEQAGVEPALLKNPDYVKTRGGLLEGVEYFDAFFFDYIPEEAEVMNPQLRLFHENVWQALENAGCIPGDDEGLIGVYAGASQDTGWDILAWLSGKTAGMDAFAASHLINSEYLCTRVSYKLDLQGPSFIVQTACSTSLVAVHLACQGLLSGECDIAAAGGVNLALESNTGYVYREGKIFSRDGHCRAFDAKATGTAGGEGVGIVVLKSLEEALAEGDYIYAVIKGTAINNDGAGKVGFSAPGVKGQTKVIRTALAAAEVEPETIGFIETHGTGTSLGDPVEIDALTQAFDTTKKGFCAIGSVKTNIGHLGIAAGIAGFIKAVLALKYKQIPPTLHFESPNPRIDFENSPFYVNTRLSGWKNKHYPLRAGVSSFGIGGTNAHVILEAAPGINGSAGQRVSESIRQAPEGTSGLTPLPVKKVPGQGRGGVSPPEQSRKYQLILLSAKTPVALEKMAENLTEHLKKNPGINLADTAYTLQLGRKAFPYRKMQVASHAGEVIAALSDSDSARVKTLWAKEENRPVIFMFSGQGFQYIDMGLELYRQEPYFRRLIDNCSDILEPLLALDIKEILYPDRSPEEAKEKLNQTEILQPVTVSFQYALSSLLMKWGITPAAVIGHSLGEYAAASIAGIISLEDALKLAAVRGRLLQTVPPGSMLSVPLPEEDLKPWLGNELSLAAVNSRQHCIVSGTPRAVAELAKQLTEKGHDCRTLHVSYAGHSQMVEPIMAHLTDAAKQIKLKQPQIPYISGVTGTWITGAEAVDQGYWARQLRNTVRFNDGVTLLLEKQDKIFIEIGPGKSLCTFLQQNENFTPGHLVLNVSKHPLEDFPDDYFLIDKIGQIWLRGGQIRWQDFYYHEIRQRIPLPTYPFEGEKFWFEQEVFHRLKVLEGYLKGGPLPPLNRPGHDANLLRPQERSAGTCNWDHAAPTTALSKKRQRPPTIGTKYVAPGNRAEYILAEIWQAFFGIEAIGINDNFFDLGGDSLKMMSLVSKIHQKLALKVPIADFFKIPTIQQLAKYINGMTGSFFKPVVPGEEQEYYDVSPAQQRMWTTCRVEKASISFNMPAAVILKGEPDIHALDQALQKLIRRHESLRTSFTTVEGKPKQIVHKNIKFTIKQETLTGAASNLSALLHQHETRLFDLAAAPLLDVKLLKLQEKKYALLLNMHHIIFDGWSMNIFSRELITLYNAYLNSASPGNADIGTLLTPLPIQYKDYSCWHNRIVQEENTGRLKEYWLKKFSSEPPVLDFPTDYLRPEVKTYNGNIFQSIIDHQLVSGLKRLKEQQGVTLYITLLAAVKVLICHYTGQEDITIGTQTAGRLHPDLEDQIGYYVNLLPLRDRINGKESFEVFLQQVKQTAADAYDNQLYPFDQLVDELNLDRDNSRHPLFDIMVDLQNFDKKQLEFQQMETSPIESPGRKNQHNTSRFDLTFTFVERDHEILLTIEYNTDLFKKDRIRRIFVYFTQLLKSINRDCKQTVQDIVINY